MLDLNYFKNEIKPRINQGFQQLIYLKECITHERLAQKKYLLNKNIYLILKGTLADVELTREEKFYLKDKQDFLGACKFLFDALHLLIGEYDLFHMDNKSFYLEKNHENLIDEALKNFQSINCFGN